MPDIYVITDPCIDVKDASCAAVCPVDCIHTSDTDRVCYIDPLECVGCNLCLPACPVGAIFTGATAPPVWTSINARWFGDADGARAEVDTLAR